MTQAARSIRANIAEGSGRHETSFETEMRLTDVARASCHELMGDYLNFMMRHSLPAWSTNDSRFLSVFNAQLDKPVYGSDFISDALAHINRQMARFDRYLVNGDASEAANCLVALCLKINAMLTRMLAAQLHDFKKQGGFAENLTQVRLEARKEEAATRGAPICPQCGKPMLKRTIQRGSHQGSQFWGCSDYPKCNGTRNL